MFGFVSSLSSQMTCDATLTITEASTSTCSKEFEIEIDLGTETSLNAFMIELDETFIDFTSVTLHPVLTALDISFTPGNGEINFGSTLTNLSSIEGFPTIYFEVFGTPDLCIDSYILDFFTYIEGVGICNYDVEDDEIVIPPSPQSCFESEEICGNIQNAFGHCNQTSNSAIVGVDVRSNDGCGGNLGDETDSNGDYCFTIFENTCVDISINNTSCPECENSITELDIYYLEELMQELNGLSNSLTRSQVLAGDVNGDGSLSAMDLLALRRIELGIDPGPNPECMFYVASEMFESDANFDTTADSCEEMDFVMVVPGDINGNCGECDFGESGATPIVVDTLFDVRDVSGITYLKTKKPLSTLILTLPTTSGFDYDDLDFLISDEDYAIDSVWADNAVTIILAGNQASETLPINTDIISFESSVSLGTYTNNAWNSSGWYEFDFDGFTYRNVQSIEPMFELFEESSELNIILKENIDKGSLQVFTIEGKMLFHKPFLSLNEGESIKVPLTGIKGIIFVRIDSEKIGITQSVFIP